jgi:hypothetical protein
MRLGQAPWQWVGQLGTDQLPENTTVNMQYAAAINASNGTSSVRPPGQHVLYLRCVLVG